MQSPSVSSCSPPPPPRLPPPPPPSLPPSPGLPTVLTPQHPSLQPPQPFPSLPPAVIPGLSISARGTVGKAVCVGSSQQLPSITAHCSVAS